MAISGHKRLTTLQRYVKPSQAAIAGEGDGFAWEVQHVIKHCAAARAILSLPLDARRKALSRQQRYDAFRRRFGHVFPQPLPEAIDTASAAARPGSARS